MSTVKQRSIDVYVDFGAVIRKSDETVLIAPSHTLLGSGTQYTESEEHSYDISKRRWSSGGPFFTSRYTPFFNTVDVSEITQGTKLYTGPVYCLPPTTSELNALGAQTGVYIGSPNESQMNSDGATAIARCAPGNPASNLGQAVAETMHEGLPSLHGANTWSERTLRAKSAGDEYLNHQFGWAPLVNDVKSGARVAGQSGLEAERFERREGRTTRRTYAFPSETTETTIDGKNGNGARFPGVSTEWWIGNQPERTVTRITSRHRWFVGAFAHLPPPKSDSWRKHIESGQRARALYGLNLTPELLWEVAPWSWAVDWFANAGDVLSNLTTLSSQGGQVMRYGYMMEETIDKVTATIHKGLLHNSKHFVESGCSSGFEVVTKRRTEANPFGFGVSWKGLSPFQLSIAAALGISRLL